MTQSTDPTNSRHGDFNQSCYELLKRIPKGRITTYKAIAEALNSKAYRAVGNAMAHNPNLIKVPCHRVVKSNGEVGQYALGSAAKIELLEQEGVKIVNNKVVEFETRFYDFDL